MFYNYLDRFSPKEIAPLVGAAAIGSLGSIFGGLLGSKGQSSANSTNLQIARETNAANRANQEYQNQWNLEQWNRENAYNSPIMQRTRLEEAGLNPIFFGLDGNSGGTGLQSAPFTAQQGAPMQNGMAPLAQGLTDAALKYAQIQNIEANTKKVEEDTENVAINNEIAKASKDDIIDTNHYTMLVTKGQVDLTENQARLVDKQITYFGEQITSLQQQREIAQQQIGLDRLRLLLDAIYKEYDLSISNQKMLNDFYLGKQDLYIKGRVADAQINVYGAQVGLLNAQTDSVSEDVKSKKFVNMVNRKRVEKGIIEHSLNIEQFNTKQNDNYKWFFYSLDKASKSNEVKLQGLQISKEEINLIFEPLERLQGMMLKPLDIIF